MANLSLLHSRTDLHWHECHHCLCSKQCFATRNQRMDLSSGESPRNGRSRKWLGHSAGGHAHLCERRRSEVDTRVRRGHDSTVDSRYLSLDAPWNMGEDNSTPLVMTRDDAEAPANWIVSGPHLMLTPRVPSSLDEFTTDFRTGSPYLMFGGTEYAHLIIPMEDYYHHQQP